MAPPLLSEAATAAAPAGPGAADAALDRAEAGQRDHDADEATAGQTYCHEPHYSTRNGWLRALVLGANDGIVSVGALVIGVAAANTSRAVLMTTGISGLVAGALSMGMGEFVSVSSQKDAEEADFAKETKEHQLNPEKELDELTKIYENRGIPRALARQVAEELHRAGDAVGVHMREEIGVTEVSAANPIQACLVSMAAFTAGAVWPVIAAVACPEQASVRLPVISVVSVIALGLLGWLGAFLGGARVVRATLRTLITGTAAMAITALIGWGVGKATGAGTIS